MGRGRAGRTLRGGKARESRGGWRGRTGLRFIRGLLPGNAVLFVLYALPRPKPVAKAWMNRGARKARLNSRVEERRGITEATRFPSPLIKPDVRISRIRLSDWLHDRLTTWRLSVAEGVASAYQDRRIPPPS